MNNRNRALLDLAHRVTECQNCGRTVTGCEPAHQNGPDSGKGFACKAPDNRHAALCHDCHAWYDQGGTRADPTGIWQPTYEDKRGMWQRAHLRTFDLYWRSDWLKVNR